MTINRALPVWRRTSPVAPLWPARQSASAGSRVAEPVASPLRQRYAVALAVRQPKLCPFVRAGMLPRPLWDQQYTNDDTHREDGRGLETAQGEPAMVHRLVEEVAHRGTERPREDERSPEQQSAGNAGIEVEPRNDRQR